MALEDRIKVCFGNDQIVDSILDAIVKEDKVVLVAINNRAKADWIRRSTLKRVPIESIVRTTPGEIVLDKTKVRFVSINKFGYPELMGYRVDTLILDSEIPVQAEQALIPLVY